MELTQSVPYVDISQILQYVARNMNSEKHPIDPATELRRLTKRLCWNVGQSADKALGFQEDINRPVVLADFDTTTKSTRSAKRGSGIERFKILRICSIDYLDEYRTTGILYCSFFALLRLNPRTLLIPSDENTIRLYEATEENNAALEQKFFDEMNAMFEGSPHLQYLCDFRRWNCHRVDYTSNMRFEDHDSFRIFKILMHRTSKFVRTKRVRIKEKKLYEQSAAERNKSYKSLFYDKHEQYTNMSKNIRESDKSRALGESQNVLRLEQQCRPGKISSLKETYRFPDRKAWRFLREDIARELLYNRYDKMVGDGDFYQRKKAYAIIRKNIKKKFMQDRLIQFLQLIASKRHIDIAREVFTSPSFDGDKFPLAHGKAATFRAWVKKLRELGINPVLIPEKQPIRFLKNPKSLITFEN